MKFAPKFKLARHKELNEYLDGKFIAPINVEISLAGVCNAKCAWCFYLTEKDNTLIDAKAILKLLDEFNEIGVKAVTWTGGGEPTLHPDFKAISEKAHSHGIKQGLITNGVGRINYDPSLFKWIRISKTNHDWNIENLKKIRKARSVGLCINYTGDDDEIKETLRIAHEVGIDYVQVRPALEKKGKKTFIKKPNIKDPLLLITDYKFEEATKDRVYTECEGHHFVPFIWQDGTVAACAYQRRNKEYNLGNIYTDSFLEIMKKAPKSMKVLDNCQICCKNHEINTLLWDMRKLEDIEFV